MKQCVIEDVRHILYNKLSILVCFVNLGFVMLNFLDNIKTNDAQVYASQMYEIPKLLLLSEWSIYGYFYLILFPVLVVLPTHALQIQDRKSGMEAYIITRTNHVRYAWMRYLSVFFGTVILFFIPILIEWGLSMICLEQSANGDPSNFSYYVTAQNIGDYPMAGLYEWNKFIYALVWGFVFSIFSGCCAVINLAIANFIHFKYGIFAMLPLYIILNLIARFHIFPDGNYTANYSFFLRMFSSGTIQYPVILAVVFVLMIVSLGLFFWSGRKK